MTSQIAVLVLQCMRGGSAVSRGFPGLPCCVCLVPGFTLLCMHAWSPNGFLSGLPPAHVCAGTGLLPVINTDGDGCGYSGCLACEGDCDSNSDCAGDLQCYQRRSPDSTVPSCQTTGYYRTTSDWDYCYDPSQYKKCRPCCPKPAQCRRGSPSLTRRGAERRGVRGVQGRAGQGRAGEWRARA